ncbi:MAG: hypothetical protein ACRCUH_15055 [Shewanella sp.]
MSDMTLIPTGGNEGTSAGIGGLIGGGLGALFGQGFGGFGNFGRGAAGAADIGLQNAIDTNAVLNGINQLQQSQNTQGITLLQGQNGTNTTVERAAASTYTGLTAQNTSSLLASVQGFAGLNTVIQTGNNDIVAAIGSADRAALERSYQAQLAAAKCCCETNLNIERQGNQTRDLMREQFAQAQAVTICDLKSANQALQFQNSQIQQTALLSKQISELECLVSKNAKV